MEFYLKYQRDNNQTMFSSNVWETIMHIDCITETVLKEMDQTHRQSEWWESQAKSPVWSTSSIVSSAPCKGNSFADGIIPSLPHAATISKQKLPKAVLWRAKDFPLWRMLLSLTAKCTLWQRRGMIFPGVQTILSSHPHSHEFFRSGFGTVGFSVSHSMKQCIMNTAHAPPQTNRMPLWFIYFWNPCQQGENTADCTLQQFSGILQSHFISFSSLNPVTLTQLTFLIEKYDFWIL